MQTTILRIISVKVMSDIELDGNVLKYLILLFL